MKAFTTTAAVLSFLVGGIAMAQGSATTAAPAAAPAVTAPTAGKDAMKEAPVVAKGKRAKHKK